MTYKQLINHPDYTEHHTASRRGYVSRKGGRHIEPYVGKFGIGYVVLSPRWDTTQYIHVTYYIRNN